MTPSDRIDLLCLLAIIVGIPVTALVTSLWWVQKVAMVG